MFRSATSMPLLGHIEELRRRLIVSLIAIFFLTVASWVFYDTIVPFLLKPFSSNIKNGNDSALYVNSVTEGFLTKFKIAALCGVVFSLPVHLYNVLRFIIPGLTKRERSAVLISLVVSTVLAFASFLYAFTSVIPVTVRFLTRGSFIPERVGMLLSFERNVSYVLQFLLVTILLFQLPVLVELLLAMKLLSRRGLIRAIRPIIVAVFVIAAVLTPPDFLSQLGLAVPLIVLLFLTIAVAKIFRFGGE